MRCAFILIAALMFLVGCQTEQVQNMPTVSLLEATASDTPSRTLPTTGTDLPPRSPTVVPTGTATPTPEPSPTPTRTLALGATQISPVDGMVLVYVPAGEFLMGSTDADTGADYDEFPQHLITLDAFWIDRTVVTNAMYAKFLNELGNQIEGRTTWLDAGDEDVLLYQQEGIWRPVSGYEQHPVVEVTWFGAQAYCQRVGRRLPTEAEWEHAARGADARVYPWGNDIDCEHAQYANCGGGLLPVGSKSAGVSPYGVLGLSGNTWEWVADWYADDYYATSPADNPSGLRDGETRVLRGGSWEYDWKHLRAANRRNNGPAVSMHDYGFRCVLNSEMK